MRRSLAALLGAALLAVAGATAVPAVAVSAPVRCSENQITPDGRVFPEPRVSVSYLQLGDFECGVAFLERRHPNLIEMTSLGKSKGGYDIWDVVLTNEAIPGDKPKLLIVSSIHGNEQGAREGGARVIEDLVTPSLQGNQPWVRQVLDEFAIHFVFPNPDGWVKGDVHGHSGSGLAWTRGNNTGRDLNRNFPVKGFISAANGTLAEPESNAVNDKLFSQDGWYLGTDNHGQGADTYAAAGLQIVGQFDFQKSETLARFADAITPAMAEYGVLDSLEALRQATGQDLGPYHWGTLYDMLGYSASGSMIDYYNTFDGVGGTGYATELTVGQGANAYAHPQVWNQVHVDSIRAINFTMLKQAIDPVKFTYAVGSRAAYLFDPLRIRHDDFNGEGYVRKSGENIPQQPYDVSRMRFFSDLNKHADRPLDAVRVSDVMSGAVDLAAYDSLVISNNALPEPADEAAWYGALRTWVEQGGNLILTDRAALALPKMGVVPAAAVTSANHYVGFVTFGDRTHHLNANLRGVASQTYDTVPIGYSFGGSNAAPNWKVSTSAWQGAGGYSAGTNGSGQTIYGELPLGKGRIRFLGALLPDPTEAFYHPYGLQNYAVTYTGYTLLQNMLRWERPEA